MAPQQLVVVLLLAARASAASAPPPEPARAAASLDPAITIEPADDPRSAAMRDAVATFLGAGLPLPDLSVHLSGDPIDCHGHDGYFDPGPDPWRITVCADAPYVHLHELAHAWEVATSTVERRRGFMQLRGYRTWSDHAVGWNERGMEGAAFIIQQGLGGLPLPAVLSAELRSRVAAFEYLTGMPDPRLMARHRGGPTDPTSLAGRPAQALPSSVGAPREPPYCCGIGSG